MGMGLKTIFKNNEMENIQTYNTFSNLQIKSYILNTTLNLKIKKNDASSSKNPSENENGESGKNPPKETTFQDPHFVGKFFYPALGIDLGTTYSVVGVVQNNKSLVIPNLSGIRTTPSYVGLQSNSQIIGDGAKSLAVYYPKAVAYDAKRMIGKNFRHPDIQTDVQRWPFHINAEDESDYKIRLEFESTTKEFRPVEISGIILSELRRFSEKYTMRDCVEVVITVPAYFNEDQRKCTRDAGAIAGFDVLRIVNEPTAAAIAYGFDKSQKKKTDTTVCVFDLGGGTYDVTVLLMNDGIFEVLATSGDTHLGGEDFDIAATNHFLKKFEDEHNCEKVSRTGRTYRRLKAAFERAKRTLSSQPTALVTLENVAPGIPFHYQITRARYEEATKDIFKRIEPKLALCISLAGKKKTQIEDIVLIGGSTRMPKVRKFIENFFTNKDVNKSINPDEAVALGAAVHGAALTGFNLRDDHRHILLMDVIPLAIGVNTQGGIFSRVVQANSAIPCTARDTFGVTNDFQTEAVISVWEGDRTLCKENHYLGEYRVSVKPARAWKVKLLIEFFVNADGMLTVTARDTLGYNKKETMVIESERRIMDADEIEKIRKDAKENADKDRKARTYADAIAKISNTIQNMTRYLENFTDEELEKNSVLKEKYAELRSYMLESEDWIKKNDFDSVDLKDVHDRKSKLDTLYTNFKVSFKPTKTASDEPPQAPELT